MRLKNILYALLRISLGWVFLWSFVDKLFGLGFATASDRSWLGGASPTQGFLQFATKGPFAEFYQSLAGNVLVDWLFMLGLLGMGLALMLGVLMRVAATAGVLMMVLMYTAAFMPPENNPIVDDHVIYALLLVLLAVVNAGNYWGLGNAWGQLPLVRKYSWLK